MVSASAEAVNPPGSAAQTPPWRVWSPESPAAWSKEELLPAASLPACISPETHEEKVSW